MKKFSAVVLALMVCTASWTSWAEGYRTTVGTAPDQITVAVVKGTAYEMGHALGSLLKDEMSKFMPVFLMGAQIMGGDQYTDANLDAAWTKMEPYISQNYKDELKGLADGSGLPYDSIRRAHMIPAVSEYSCSGIAIWGKATSTNHLYQIRNLDYITDGGLQDYPVVVVYIPNEGVAHVNATFAGVIGCNTGMNAEGVTLSEIGDSPEKDLPYDLDGIHFMIMFRDILYKAKSLDEAVQMIKDAKRIKKYHFVVGDGKNLNAVKMKAWAPELEIFTDNDSKDENAPNVFENVVYHAESRTPTARGHISQYCKGEYDADSVMQLSKAIGSLGGNLMNVVYDATSLEVWVAFAEGKEECAYRRPFTHVNMKDYIPYNASDEKIKIEKTAAAPAK